LRDELLLGNLSSPFGKNISVFVKPKSELQGRRLAPAGGAYRDRHGRRARDTMDAAAPGAGITCEKMMLRRTAKSWFWRQKWHNRHFSRCSVQKWPVSTQFVRKTAFIAGGPNDF
jgi:hypothetical protein